MPQKLTADNAAVAISASTGGWVNSRGGVRAKNLTSYGIIASERATVTLVGAIEVATAVPNVAVLLSQFSSFINFAPSATSTSAPGTWSPTSTPARARRRR